MGYWTEDWRVLQTNFSLDYDLPIKGLTAKGVYSYYYADKLMNGHEYTYDVYTYFPATEDSPEEYRRTAGSDNPWRERGTDKVLETVTQGQLNYNNIFNEKHTVGGTFVYERIHRRILNTWVHTVPTNKALPLLQFADMDTYNDGDYEEARIGYVGRLNYSYLDKFYFEASGRYDASWKFSPENRWGFFPSVSGGWRFTNEPFFTSVVDNSALSDLMLRASYGKLGDDDVGIGSFDYRSGYNYGTSNMIIDGNLVRGARDRGVPITSISWFTSTVLDIGLDYAFLDGKVSGSLDFFNRKREGLRGRRWDILTPVEIGYDLPDENVNTDAVIGGEGSLLYRNTVGEVDVSLGANMSYARHRKVSTYLPRWGNSWEHYRTSIEDRWSGVHWGYEVIGQFQSMDEISSHPINNDGQGNRTLLPGDFYYADVNEDGVIDERDERPIGFAREGTPIVNYGLNLSLSWKNFDLTADFSGGTMYSYLREHEMRNPFQNTGNLLRDLYEDSWQREDPFNIDGQWIPGEYPALRCNQGGHSNYRTSNRWLTNLVYLRMPPVVLEKLRMQRMRVFVNTFNLFSIDPLRSVGLDPEVYDTNGLQYPQSFILNAGANLSF